MKRPAVVMGASLLVVCALLISFSPSQRPSPGSALSSLLGGSVPSGSTFGAKAVRVEYIDNPGILRAWTECDLVNPSVSQTLTLGEVFLLGPRGTAGPVVTFLGLRGTLVPPLGHVTLTIDNTIPGVLPWSGGRPAGGTNTAVFTWSGGAAV